MPEFVPVNFVTVQSQIQKFELNKGEWLFNATKVLDNCNKVAWIKSALCEEKNVPKITDNSRYYLINKKVIQNPVQILKKYAFQKITHVTVGIFELLNFALLNNKVLRT